MGAQLTVKNLSQGQGLRGPRLFSGVEFSWRAPSLQVIMGGSGSGKSTLLKCLGGVWRPAEGEIRLNDEPLWREGFAGQSPSAVRRIGFAFQNNALFSSMSVIENLLYPHRERRPDTSEAERREKAHELLRKVGLEASAAQMPFELSGGMQKRLAIIRALILEPDFLFLDDPTAGLDPISSKRMSELLKSLLKDSHALVVIVTNDPDRAHDWGPEIHFLCEKQLFSPGDARYRQIKETYISR